MTAGGPERGRGRLGAGAALFALTLLAYLPALGGGFVWDDDAYVTGNTTLGSAEGLYRIWFEIGAVPQYYPLVHTTFWIEHRLWGLDPTGYHVVNVLLHAGAACLLWLVLRRLRVRHPWLIAAVFALHPVHVESVAWITERKNVLSGLLSLGALLCYLRFHGRFPGPEEEAGERSWRLYAASLALFLAALLSKTTAATLPAAILVILWWRRAWRGPRELPLLLPFFAAAGLAGWTTIWVEQHVVGAAGEGFALAPAERWLIAGRALWFYAGKLVWPRSLTFIYPRWELEPGSFGPHLFPLAAVGVLAGLWLLRGRLGRGPAAAVLLFAGTLFPALGFFDVYPFRYSFVADHFQYLASIGVLALGVAAGSRALARLGRAPRRAVAALLLLLLGGLTWRQSRAYEGLESLWRDTLSKNPEAWLAHNNLGVLLADRGRTQEAIRSFTRALELNPGYARAWFNRGTAHQGLGEDDRALADFTRALEVNPERAEAYVNRAVLLEARGELEEASEDYRRALEIAPASPVVRNNLANVYRKLGDGERALEQYDAALAISPGYDTALVNRGNLLLERDEARRALRDFETALEIAPRRRDALKGRALAHGGLGNYEECVDDLDELLRLSPEDAEAHYYRALALARLGAAGRALAGLDRALELRPGLAEARLQRARLRLSAGDRAGAAEDARLLRRNGFALPPDLRLLLR